MLAIGVVNESGAIYRRFPRSKVPRRRLQKRSFGNHDAGIAEASARVVNRDDRCFDSLFSPLTAH